jgi:DNA-binding transcriptional LysR family regulator
VPRTLHDFRQEAPRVRVVLRQEPYHEILRDLASGLVGAGLGLAILPGQLVGASGTTGIPLAAAGAERVVGLTWRTDRNLPRLPPGS